MSTITVWILVLAFNSSGNTVAPMVIDNIASKEACNATYSAISKKITVSMEQGLFPICMPVEKVIIK